MNSKNLFASKTFWLGFATFALGGLGALQTAHPDWQWILMLVGFANMVLRTYTDKPVHIGEQDSV